MEKQNILDKAKLGLATASLLLSNTLSAQELPLSFWQYLDTAQVSVRVDSTDYTPQEFLKMYFQKNDSVKFEVVEMDEGKMVLRRRKKQL